MSDGRKSWSSDMLKLEEQLCFALYEASRAAIDIYRPWLEELGITYPQYLVLFVLWERGSSSVKELGQLLRLDSGTLSPLLKRLEAARLITRQRRVNDERVVDISLTSDGHALRERAASIPRQFVHELDLTFEEYSRLLLQMKQLTARLPARERSVAQG